MRKEESLAAFAARTRLEIGGLGVPKGAFELVKDRGIYLFTPPSRQEGRKQSRRYSRLVAKKRKESQLPSSSSSLLNIDPFTFHTLTCDQALKTAENKFLRTPGRRRLAKRRGLCDSELFELLPPGDRPDTIVVRGIPVRWFVLSAKVEAYNRRKRERSTLRRDCDGVNNGKQEDAVRKSGIGRAQEVPMKRKGEHENAENRMAYESFDGEKEIAVKSAMYRGQGNNEEDGDGEYGVEGKEEGELEEEEEEKYDVDDALYHFARGKDGPGVERVIEMFERFGELAFFTKIIEVRGARESKFSKAKRERRKIPRLSILCSMDSASLSGEEARMNMTFDVVVQFHQYSGFLAACRSLFGSQILAVSPGSSSESIPCLVEIDLEGYFTKESINRREVQEKMEQDREKALRGAEQKRRNQILRTLRSKMIAIDKGVESSKEDFAIMIDKVSALEKEAVQYKNGEGIVKELIELTIEPLEQLLVKVEDKRADGVWMRDQLMGKGEGADNSKVGGGAGSDVSLEGYQACITAYGKLQRLYKKSMGRAERAVDETLSDFRNQPLSLEEALIEQCQGAASSCTDFVDMMEEAITKAHINGWRLSPTLARGYPLLPLQHRTVFVPTNSALELGVHENFWGVHVLSGFYTISDFHSLKSLETVDDQHTLRIRLDGDGEWIVEVRKLHGGLLEWSLPARVVRQDIKCRGGVCCHVVDRLLIAD